MKNKKINSSANNMRVLTYLSIFFIFALLYLPQSSRAIGSEDEGYSNTAFRQRAPRRYRHYSGPDSRPARRSHRQDQSFSQVRPQPYPLVSSRRRSHASLSPEPKIGLPIPEENAGDSPPRHRHKRVAHPSLAETETAIAEREMAEMERKLRTYLLPPQTARYDAQRKFEWARGQASTRWWTIRDAHMADKYAKARLEQLEEYRKGDRGPFLHIDRMIHNPEADVVMANLPPLPARITHLGDIATQLAPLYSLQYPNGAAFTDLERQPVSSQRLENLLNNEKMEDTAADTLASLKKRVWRIISQIRDYWNPPDTDDFMTRARKKDYASQLMQHLYEAESTCIDNAATEIEKAIILYRTGLDHEKLLVIAIEDYKKFLLLAQSVTKADRESVESWMANYRRVQISMHLHPVHARMRYEEGVGANHQDYTHLIQFMLSKMTVADLIQFLQGINEIPEMFRQVEYHKACDERTGFTEAYYERPDLPQDHATSYPQELQIMIREQAPLDLTALGLMVPVPTYPITLFPQSPAGALH